MVDGRRWREQRWIWLVRNTSARARLVIGKTLCRSMESSPVILMQLTLHARTGSLALGYCAAATSGGEAGAQSAEELSTITTGASHRFTCTSRHGQCACWLRGPCDQPTCALYKYTCTDRNVKSDCKFSALCNAVGAERVERFDRTLAFVWSVLRTCAIAPLRVAY